MLLKKNRDKNLSSNYRPISCMGKVYERIIKNALDSATARQNIIPPIHSGFRRGRSTQENFYRLTEGIPEGFKQNKVTIGAFVDLNKAFDAVHQDSLRVRLLRQRLPAKLTRTISSFLRDRYLYVAEGDVNSEEILMLGGTPQGSIQSPTLFILLSADAPVVSDGIEEDGSIFADDINMWATAKNLNDCIPLIQRRINIFAEWCDRWRFSPSPPKLKVVIFTKKRKMRNDAKKRSIYMNNSKISWAQEVTFPGTICKNLDFKSHIDGLIHKSYVKTKSIRKLCQFGISIDQDIVISLIHSLFFSAFHYSAPTYLGMSPLIWGKINSFFSRTFLATLALLKMN